MHIHELKVAAIVVLGVANRIHAHHCMQFAQQGRYERGGAALLVAGGAGKDFEAAHTVGEEGMEALTLDKVGGCFVVHDASEERVGKAV